LKGEITQFLSKNATEFEDFGIYTPDPADYPDIAVKVAEAVARGEFDGGILICGTGMGMSIVANKVPGIRATLCTDSFGARSARQHNNSNILVLGERVTGVGSALDVVQTWLSTDFSNAERHVERVRKISEVDKKYNGGRC
jgi:ribose 5-phosphate isomerase B